jgi:hypothetical protein
MSTELALIVPKSDYAEFAALPDVVRREVRLWQGLLSRVSPPYAAAYQAIAAQVGTSVVTVKRKHLAVRASGWRALINYSRLADPERALPPAFVEYWRKLAEQNQRKSAPAIRELHRRWRRREPIPGYAGHPGWPELPRGWSESNLYRHLPTRHQLTAARLGRDAADAFRPLVYSGRLGLYVGSHYMLDDMWHDFFINSLAEGQAGRPLELFSHDLYSARKVRWGVRVRTRDGTKYKGLTKAMTRMVIAATLYLDGYHPRGTTLVVEYGAAGVDGELKTAVTEATHGTCKTHESGMKGAAAHSGQYGKIAGGNFRHKASLESGNNLTHNEFAHLPGQTGKDLAHRPSELAPRLDYNSTILAAAMAPSLPLEVAAKLEYPLLDLPTFLSTAAQIYGHIDDYTEHDLSDWVECGHIVSELQIGGQWIPASQLTGLPERERALLAQGLEAGQIATRVRKLSRREVWDKGSGELVRIDGAGVCEILGPEFARPRAVVNGQFEFQDAEIEPGVTFRYTRLATALDGSTVELQDGETYQTFVNPFAPDSLFVRNMNGAYIGECRAPVRALRLDDEATRRAMGEAAHLEALSLEALRRRHLEEGRAKAAMHRHNEQLLSGTTPEDKAKARELAARARETGTAPIDQLLAADSTTDEAPQTPNNETPEDRVDALLSNLD